ncbi:FadR/GntR family transcriptional regulator [Salimicrobium halophilum]|uniref:Transcriptional regulator, GntR family n=1 Tax=Salimicrobium halophilum TaxID=86666 RepID=A0A1G8RKD6_9BACI|nr:FadR/GntR family transcriptional regulator [Salimicrobium halophilum]SDJ17416.1 transcriptional regulator, GntR family [Salimicrobium halophilum]
MEYKQIRTKKIYEQVADSLIEMIKNGDLSPGDKLESVETLARNFDVGRSAIREALSGLRSMGLLEMKQGEGTYVKEFEASKFTLPVPSAFLMNIKDVKELYQVRKMLEVGTAGLAAEHHDDEDLEAIHSALQAMKKADKEELAEKADHDFHMAIVKATHNDMLTYLMGSVSEIMAETIRDTRRVLLYTEEKAHDLFSEHEKIYNAIKNNNSDLAEKAMYTHLAAVEMLLFQHLEK